MGAGWGHTSTKKQAPARRSRLVGPTFVPQSSFAGRSCAAGRVLTCRRERGTRSTTCLRHMRTGGSAEAWRSLARGERRHHFAREAAQAAPAPLAATGPAAVQQQIAGADLAKTL